MISIMQPHNGEMQITLHSLICEIIEYLMLDVLQGHVLKLHNQYLTGKSYYDGPHSYSKVIRAQRSIVYTSW